MMIILIITSLGLYGLSPSTIRVCTLTLALATISNHTSTYLHDTQRCSEYTGVSVVRVYAARANRGDILMCGTIVLVLSHVHLSRLTAASSSFDSHVQFV